MSFLKMSSVVLGNLFRKPYTRLYPFVKREPYQNTRGQIAIDINACIYCGICQKRCPAQAIEVSKTDRNWAIDRMRCVMCNACVEVCPKKCLSMETSYTTPLIQGKKVDLIQGPPAAPAPTPAQ